MSPDLATELAKLEAAVGLTFAVGDVWWVPGELVRELKPLTDAFCLVARLEYAGDGTPLIAHIVAGSRNTSSRATVEVGPGETQLQATTYFRFWRSKDIPVATIAGAGAWRGRLSVARLDEIDSAIADSNLAVLKGLPR